MYTNILVPIDPDHGDAEAALAMARRLAEDSTATITALTVVAPIPTYAAAQIPEDVLKNTHQSVVDKLRQIVGPRSEIVTDVIHGAPGIQIVEYAKSKGVDCIVIASHKPGLADYFLGSTAARVVRHAQCTVHVMR